MKLDLDPSPHCDCRRKSIRNVRIVAAAVFVAGLFLSMAVFAAASVEDAVSRLLAGLALFTYGIATIADDTATFPRSLYALIALAGVAMTAFAVSGLL
jgi:hypothetical protein